MHADGALVLAGVCDSDLAVPYQPFAVAFADVPAGDDELAAAVADGIGPLGPLFPARRRGGLDDAGPSARFELFDAVVELVDRLAIEQPVVLALEDLQWANRSTIQLLRHLLRQATGVRLLVLASYRPEEIGPTHPLHELLRRHVRVAHPDRSRARSARPRSASSWPARLPAAPPTASARSPGASTRRAPGARSSCASSSTTCRPPASSSGSSATGAATGSRSPTPCGRSSGSGSGGSPRTQGRSCRPPPSSGSPSTSSSSPRSSTATPTSVLETLEGVAQVALVNEVGAGRFAFAHAIVRTTLLDGMSATRRALAHRRVAEAIEALGRPDHDELAQHWQLAGVEDKAYEHLELAARRDLEALAYESAAERYETVLGYQQQRPARDVRATARAWLGARPWPAGPSARSTSSRPSQEAGRLGRRLGDVDLVADAASASIMPGTYFVTAGQSQDGPGRAVRGRARAAADRRPPAGPGAVDARRPPHLRPTIATAG